MRPRAALVLLLLALCGCKPAENSRMKAVIGAVLIDGAGGPPLTDSVVVVAGDRIRAVGPRGSVPIPADADKLDGSGRFIVPGLIDVCDRADPPGSLHPATPEEARARVAELVAQKAAVLHLWKSPPAVAEAALEEARNAGVPVMGRITTEADARFFVEHGATGFVGMIRDTGNLDPVFVSRLRDLRIVFAPALVQAGGELEAARRNTRRLFAAGVPMAVASAGGDFQREAELLEDTGLPPLDVIVAATRNGAMALRKLDESGDIQPGKRANLLVLSANPGETIRNLRRVERRMINGEWVR